MPQGNIDLRLSGAGGGRNRLRLGLVWLVIAASGCLFSPRSPQQAIGNEVKTKNPTSPDSVLYNIQVSMVAKSADTYGRSLADDYLFIADPADVSQTGDNIFYENLNKSREVEIFRNLLNVQSPAGFTFTWGPPIDPPIGLENPNEVYYKDLKYQMRLTGVATPVTSSGKMDLYLREANGLWSVFRWEDKRDGSANQTLGYYRWKGKFL
jgi:hypothetical protein